MRVLVVGAVLAAERVVAAHVLGHLHLDHVGAPVGELAAAVGPARTCVRSITRKRERAAEAGRCGISLNLPENARTAQSQRVVVPATLTRVVVDWINMTQA